MRAGIYAVGIFSALILALVMFGAWQVTRSSDPSGFDGVVMTLPEQPNLKIKIEYQSNPDGGFSLAKWIGHSTEPFDGALDYSIDLKVPSAKDVGKQDGGTLLSVPFTVGGGKPYKVSEYDGLFFRDTRNKVTYQGLSEE